MNKKSVYLLTILLSVFLMGGALLAQEGQEQGNQNGICFQPMDLDRTVCINFRTSWYYPYALSEWMVLHVRTAGSPSSKHIWNAGQYLLTVDEWEKVRSALASQGLPERCLHPEYRMGKENKIKVRREACKLQ